MSTPRTWPSFRPLLALALLALLLGAAANFGIAFRYCKQNVGDGTIPFNAQRLTVEEHDVLWWQENRPSRLQLADAPKINHRHKKIGATVEQLSHYIDTGSNLFLDQHALRVRAGWPVRALEFSVWRDNRLVYAALPIRPLWPGIVLNTVAYAIWFFTIMLATTIAFNLWRIHRRIVQGLCSSCTYPIGASPLCTECGQRLPNVNNVVGGEDFS